MSCCCPSCDARMIELIQAIDELRRTLADQSRIPISEVASDANWYWNFG